MVLVTVVGGVGRGVPVAALHGGMVELATLILALAVETGEGAVEREREEELVGY